MEVLDLFSAAAGGWSLGMHRAGFRTIAACEAVEWRRALYAQNNPGVHIYDDVRTLTAERLLHDLGRLPSVVVGSPPCQDISSANTKGRGVEGERSGLFFEAIRIIGECRPRWFALENSANLRTRGADAVLAALEALGYACWPLVVRAGDIGANHERPRCWLIGCDVGQAWNADFEPGAERLGHSPGEGRDALGPRRLRPDAECGGGRPFHASDTPQNGRASRAMAIRPADSGDLATGWPLWSLDDLAGRLRLDDGLPARVAGTRVAVGGPRGTAAASLIVEAYGDAVVPQIPEATGRAILRVEVAMRAVAAQPRSAAA